jgi:thiosulfate/3-mercaptopyruvate sulfurtransferase
MPFTDLISCTTLSAHLQDADWVVIDCRHDLTDPERGRREYAESHIPGAHFLHLDHDLAGHPQGMPARGGRHPLPQPQAFAQTMQRLGVGPDSQVIAYDAQGGMVAARLWWMLRHWAGHSAVAVLDGGWQAWTAAALARSSDISAATPAIESFVFKALQHSVDAAWLLQQLDSPTLCLIDARAPDRFRGQNETLDPVGGRIPGARNRFFRDNLQADGRFKPASQLRSDYLALLGGLSPDQSVHQCGSGVSACHNILAMEVAGMSGMRLYPGSWSEWCADASRPIATGEPTGIAGASPSRT